MNTASMRLLVGRRYRYQGGTGLNKEMKICELLQLFSSCSPSTWPRNAKILV